MKQFFLNMFANSFIKNSAILFAGTMVVNILNYAFHLVVGRLSDPVAYGEVEAIISLVTIISVPASTITFIVMKYAAGLKADNNISALPLFIKFVNKKVFQFGTLLLVSLILITPWVKSFLNIEASLPIFFLWSLMGIIFLSAVSSGALYGLQRYVDVNKVDVTLAFLKVITAIIFIKVGFGVSGVIGGLTISGVVAYFFTFFLLRNVVKEKKLTESIKNISSSFASLRSYILPAFCGALAAALFGSIDMVFAKHHLDPFIAGQYGALSVISKTIFFATGVMSTVLFAMSAEENHQNTTHSTRTLTIAIMATAFVTSLSVLIFFLFPKLILFIFFGEKYLSVAPLLGWFGIMAAIYAFLNLFIQYLLSLHKTWAIFSFLALASLEILTLFFFGETVHAIIVITILIQAFAVTAGLIFIFTPWRYAKKNLSRNPNI